MLRVSDIDFIRLDPRVGGVDTFVRMDRVDDFIADAVFLRLRVERGRSSASFSASSSVRGRFRSGPMALGSASGVGGTDMLSLGKCVRFALNILAGKKDSEGTNLAVRVKGGVKSPSLVSRAALVALVA